MRLCCGSPTFTNRLLTGWHATQTAGGLKRSNTRLLACVAFGKRLAWDRATLRKHGATPSGYGFLGPSCSPSRSRYSDDDVASRNPPKENRHALVPDFIDRAVAQHSNCYIAEVFR